MHHHDQDELEDHDRGLAFDLTRLVDRRRALKLFGIGGLGIGVLGLNACRSDSASTAAGTTTTTATTGVGAPSTTAATAVTSTTVAATSTTAGTTTTAAPESCEVLPEETAGPYPGDGSNGPNVLTESGVVRSDLTSSFGSASGTATGVPLEIVMTVRDADRCAPLANAAVYLWHCDAAGLYSLYSQGATGANYLRGVQVTDANGQVRFRSIFPGCYAGRWPHIHFEVFSSLDGATSSTGLLSTSQLALPEDVCAAVYGGDGYPNSTRNLGQTSLARDNVFSDDQAAQQMATVTGNASGYTASLSVAV